jgi:chromosome segregation ATPase
MVDSTPEVKAKRAMEDLPVIIERLTQQLRQFSTGLAGVTQKFNDLDTKLSKVIEDATADRQKLAVTIAKLDALTNDTARVEQTKKSCEKRFSNIETQVIETEKQAIKVHERVEANTKSVHELKDQVAPIVRKVETLEANDAKLSGKLIGASGIIALILSIAALIVKIHWG